MSKKCVLILLDGLGDRSYKALEYQTPLQAAKTPFLDSLAKVGANGLYHAGILGQALPSENAHFAMFGYDMAEFPGRGALEALGAGMDLNPADVAVLAHFASLSRADRCLILEDGKPADVPEDEASALFDAVGEYEKDGVRVCLTRTNGLFCILILRGNVSPFITDTDPIKKKRPLIAAKPWTDYTGNDVCRHTANVLEEYLIWAHRRLTDHPVNLSRIKQGKKPVNGIVTQRAGRLKPATPFSQKYGLRGISVSSGIVFWGLCAYIGLDYKKVRDTEDPGKDISERLVIARELLNDYDFIHVHTKAPDEAGHSRKPLDKKAVIESLDKGIGRTADPLINDPDVFLIVTSDHSTPSAGPLVHSGEAVPLLFYGEGVRRDAVQKFDEVSAAGGALGCVRGRELMYLILNHLDRSKLQGLMDTPDDQPFYPGNYEPLLIPNSF